MLRQSGEARRKRLPAALFPESDGYSFSGLHRFLSLTALLPQFLQKYAAGWISFLNALVSDSIKPSSWRAQSVFSVVSFILDSFP
jgi:hypothetical protein